jgi:hypothetical protein
LVRGLLAHRVQFSSAWSSSCSGSWRSWWASFRSSPSWLPRSEGVTFLRLASLPGSDHRGQGHRGTAPVLQVARNPSRAEALHRGICAGGRAGIPCPGIRGRFARSVVGVACESTQAWLFRSQVRTYRFRTRAVSAVSSRARLRFSESRPGLCPPLFPTGPDHRPLLAREPLPSQAGLRPGRRARGKSPPLFERDSRGRLSAKIASAAYAEEG